MKNKELNDLANELFGCVKAKRLKPLTKQITHKGITKKWLEDGKGNFLEFVGKPKYDYNLLVEQGESNIEFVKRLIDKGYFE